MLNPSATGFVWVERAAFEAGVRKAVKTQAEEDFMALLLKYFPRHNL